MGTGGALQAPPPSGQPGRKKDSFVPAPTLPFRLQACWETLTPLPFWQPMVALAAAWLTVS